LAPGDIFLQNLDLHQWSVWFAAHLSSMTEDARPEKDEAQPKPSRTEQARQVVQEYIDDLRAIIRRLRRLN
jgi:hypothetical protein